jgi:hypothetical protein
MVDRKMPNEENLFETKKPISKKQFEKLVGLVVSIKVQEDIADFIKDNPNLADQYDEIEDKKVKEQWTNEDVLKENLDLTELLCTDSGYDENSCKKAKEEYFKREKRIFDFKEKEET